MKKSQIVLIIFCLIIISGCEDLFVRFKYETYECKPNRVNLNKIFVKDYGLTHKITVHTKKFDININVYGGGTTGQAEAVRLALSRAMCELKEENREILKPEGLLTRDPRMVERKKFGQKKARKKFQFSKR